MSLAPLGSRLQIAFWWFAWSVMALPWTLAFRWVPGNARSVPRDGPLLLLANHSSAFDPVWIAFWLFRRSSFMASSGLFRVPVLAQLLPLCGCFPKTKFVKDRDSMRTLAERYEAGDIIVLFPEGKRTFDGRTGDVLPGIGRLVKRIDARVVTARILNGHLFHPRWARYPRWVPVRVKYAAVRTWEDAATPEQINDDISTAIRINPEEPPEGLISIGFRMAEGLPDYLWACPSCFAPDGLKAHGNHVTCQSCTVRWTLDTRNRMNGEQAMWVHEAFDRIAAHFEGADLSGAATLYQIKGKQQERLAHGTASLSAEGLTVDALTLPLPELRAVSVELQNRLTFRRGDVLLELVPVGQSPLKWAHFLRWHLSAC